MEVAVLVLLEATVRTVLLVLVIAFVTVASQFHFMMRSGLMTAAVTKGVEPVFCRQIVNKEVHIFF